MSRSRLSVPLAALAALAAALAAAPAGATPPPAPPPDPDVVAAHDALAAIAADVRTTCALTSREAVYPVELMLAAAPGEAPFLEVHVHHRAGPDVGACVRERAHASLDHVPPVTRMVTVDTAFLVGRRPARLPGAASVRAAWRGALAGDALAAAELERLLPPEVSLLDSGSMFRTASVAPRRATPLATWLSRGLPRVGTLGYDRGAFLDGDLLIIDGDSLSVPVQLGGGWTSAEDAVLAALLPPDAAALARQGALPGLFVDPEARSEFGTVVVRTDDGGVIVEALSCDPVAPRPALRGARGFSADRVITVRRVRDDEGAPAWTATAVPAATVPALEPACLEHPTRGRETPSLLDQYEADVAIVRFEPLPVASRRPHEAPLVLYRLTLENRGRRRHAVLGVGCNSHFRDSPIALAPGERRAFALTRGTPYMFQGLGARDCWPGRVTYPMRLGLVRPFDLTWDQPERVSYTRCEGPVAYRDAPAGPDDCLALVPVVVTRAARGDGPATADGEADYATYLDAPLEVRCRDEGRDLSFAVPVRADAWASWLDPIRIPVGAGRPARAVTCTIDPRAVLVDADRGNNVLTVRVPATPP